MVDSVKLLRILVACEILLVIASTFVGFLSHEPLPEAVDAYFEGPGAGPIFALLKSDSTATLVAIGSIGAVLVLAYAATLMGLWLLKPWARTMYTTLFIVGVVLIPLMGASIIDPATAAVDHLVSVCSGVILALLYFGDVRGRFASNPAAT